MKVRDLGLGGVKEITPARHGDARGFFSEIWNADAYSAAGASADWMQDNHSWSAEKHVLRGLHFQTPPFSQVKLVRPITGAIFVAVADIRHGSPTFAQWTSVVLSAEVGNQIFVPEGFAHGFLTLTPDVHVTYKVSAPYAPDHDRGVRYDDPAIGVAWPLEGAAPILSRKDEAAPLLGDIDTGFRY